MTAMHLVTDEYRQVGGVLKPVVPIRRLLEWAFGVEGAGIETDPALRAGGAWYPGVGMEYVLMQRAALGIGRIDVSGGRSHPHDDAMMVAAVVEALPSALGGIAMAVSVATHARCMTAPDWMPGARPKLVPKAWCVNPHGRHPLTEVCDTLTLTSRRKGSIKVKVRWTPCVWSPTAATIRGRRQDYRAWVEALTWVRDQAMLLPLRHHAVALHLPPAAPWRKIGG